MPRRPQAPNKAIYIARIVLLAIAMMLILSAAFSQRYRVRAVKADTGATVKLPKTAKPIEQLAIPAVFSPNGDGFMDSIKFGGPDYKWFLVDIYNQLGVHILTFRNGQTWDGEGCGMGAYIYLIEAVTIEGDTLYTAGKTILTR